MRRFFLHIIAFLTPILALAQQLSVSAPQSVSLNDPYFQIRYTIAERANSISLPSLAGFEVLSGPNVSTSSSFTSINGKTSQSVSTTFTYTLQPTRKGRFTIPAATVHVNGKTVTSRSATINVTDTPASTPSRNSGNSQQRTSAASNTANAPTSLSQSSLYVKATPGRTEVYEQEPIPLSIRYFSMPGVALSSISLTAKPDFKDLVAQDIPIKELNQTTTTINGHTLNTGLIQQYVLFPQKAGKITVPAITFDCTVLQRDAAIDPFEAFFNGGGTFATQVKRATSDVVITVKPLPTPKPNNFSGGVGQFQAKAELLSPQVRTNEIATYRLTISGNGNLRLLSAPKLTFPDDFETYSPKSTDDTKLTPTGVSGSISFSYTFLPRSVGEFTIEETQLSFFNPATRQYETLVIPAQSIHVEKGTRSASDVERERELRNSDIRSIHEGEANPKEAAHFVWFGTLSYWVALTAAVLFAALLPLATSLFVRSQRQQKAPKGSKIAKESRKKISELQTQIRKSKIAETDAVHQLDAVFVEYLSHRLALSETASRDEILESLRAKELNVPDLAECLEALQMAQFAPAMAPAFSELSQRVLCCIEALERLIKH